MTGSDDAPTILVFAGSTREASHNRRLARLASAMVAESGAEAVHVSLEDYPMPLYNGDLEATGGVPEPARAFKAKLKACDGFIIACPEYNSSITPLLKNTIDWASRQEDDERPLECYRGKIAGLLAASPGALGGLRGLVHVRQMLSNIGCLVVPQQVAIAKAGEAFDDGGGLADSARVDQVRGVVEAVVDLARRLR